MYRDDIPQFIIRDYKNTPSPNTTSNPASITAKRRSTKPVTLPIFNLPPIDES